MSLHKTTDSESELELIFFITKLINPKNSTYLYSFLYPQPWAVKISLVIRIIHLVRSMDLDSHPKPESQLMSLVTQTISLFNSKDLDSQPEPLSKLISLISQIISIFSSKDSNLKQELVPEFGSLVNQAFGLKKELVSEFKSLVNQTLELKKEPKLISLIYQIFSLVISMNSNWQKLISFSPQVQVSSTDGKFQVLKKSQWTGNDKWNCFIGKWEKFRLVGEEAANHKEYEKAPLEVKHPLHPKHYLQLVFQLLNGNRNCYCCDEDLTEVFYYCSVCDYAMHIACVEKPRVDFIEQPKWHDHKLALFPRGMLLTCNVCALADSSSPIYMCPPCDFVAHLRCLNLPRVIRISRHPHRIRYTSSFEDGDWCCGVCRIRIDNDYGGYSCIKNDCSYAAHSRCSTRSNVWDGIDLEEVPEEIEEEVAEPFVRISDGIIQHFRHENHHLRLDENIGRDYDENRQCQACITPIYLGNFYSCVQCEFVLHETCANLFRKIYHPIHPHMLTLALLGRNNDVMRQGSRCSACYRLVTAGFFYECGKKECHFQLHVQCATVSEPLVHASHEHHLFLTSKPGEDKGCCVCMSSSSNLYTNETFNCIECDKNFSMCFKCAGLPQEVRYKHDTHILTLSYGDHETTYWCEVCEGRIKPREGFYMCDEYCCVTLHIKCLIGWDLYMKPGSSSFYCGEKVHVLPNNQHMSRPICSKCEKRCPQKIVFQCSGSIILCSINCLLNFLKKGNMYSCW